MKPKMMMTIFFIGENKESTSTKSKIAMLMINLMALMILSSWKVITSMKARAMKMIMIKLSFKMI